jgi:DNA segregation ATPase FtsK/SpoIIIE, S-DNA-T family
MGDTLGVVLIAFALMLAVAQWSFEARDLKFLFDPPNRPAHNLIGPVGAHLAYGVFFLFGVAGYLVPLLLVFFGLGCLLQFLSYLKRRWAWALILLICTMGLVELNAPLFQAATDHLNTTAGGIVGTFLTQVFNVFGKAGATIVFVTLYCISLLYLTNFQLGEWLRGVVAWYRERREAGLPEEQKLERRAKELKQEAAELREEVAKAGLNPNAGLGADLQPVPEPMVRDLSVPTSKPGRKAAKPEPVEEPDELEAGEVIPAEEIAAATTADILGPDRAEELKQAKGVEDEEENENENEDEDWKKPAATARPKVPAPRKPKPIAVAAAPKIGDYRLPPMDFLQHPDTNVKPSESKEELMANARLMQQTLAQFGIEVSLGDITKGPTITRYELHPAPGVKLEKITGLTNNIAAALKAERIHILAPVPGKSSVGIEVANRVKTKVIMRDLMESDEWRNSKARLPIALGKDVYGHPIIADLADMPHLLVAGSTGSGKSVCINSIIASLLYRFPPDRLRFVMIDPKVVEMQQYNRLPHLVVPVVTDPKKVVLALRWVVNEMEKRYQIFAKVGVRNIKSFNERPLKVPPKSDQQELPLTATKEKVEAGDGGFAVEVDEEIVVPRDDDIVIP